MGHRGTTSHPRQFAEVSTLRLLWQEFRYGIAGTYLAETINPRSPVLSIVRQLLSQNLCSPF